MNLTQQESLTLDVDHYIITAFIFKPDLIEKLIVDVGLIARH